MLPKALLLGLPLVKVAFKLLLPNAGGEEAVLFNPPNIFGVD